MQDLCPPCVMWLKTKPGDRLTIFLTHPLPASQLRHIPHISHFPHLAFTIFQPFPYTNTLVQGTNCLKASTTTQETIARKCKICSPLLRSLFSLLSRLAHFFGKFLLDFRSPNSVWNWNWNSPKMLNSSRLKVYDGCPSFLYFRHLKKMRQAIVVKLKPG